MHYFAYGSNMYFKQMHDRCPGSKFVGRVFLPDYTFVYDGYTANRKGAVGNIIESPGEKVWGGLFVIDEKNLKSLDEKEGYPNNYLRKDFVVYSDTGDNYTAFAYYRTGEKIGQPSIEYKDIVLRGVRDCKLPEEYSRKYIK